MNDNRKCADMAELFAIYDGLSLELGKLRILIVQIEERLQRPPSTDELLERLLDRQAPGKYRHETFSAMTGSYSDDAELSGQ